MREKIPHPQAECLKIAAENRFALFKCFERPGVYFYIEYVLAKPELSWEPVKEYTSHKWAKEIKAWADGFEIECKYVGEKYYDCNCFWGPWEDGPIDWDDPEYIFRIKE